MSRPQNSCQTLLQPPNQPIKGCFKGIEKTPIEKDFERNYIILVEICSSIQIHRIRIELFISIPFYWNEIEATFLILLLL